MAQYISKVGYGLSESLPVLAPFPIKANRAPVAADKGYAIGQMWVYVATNDVYVLTSIVNNAATWTLLEGSGGTGAFTTLTSTGQFNLDTTAVGANTLGNTTGATSLAISVGTAGFTLNGVASSSYTIGAATTTGAISIGGTAQTGTMTLGSSSGINTFVIAGGAGATTLQIANAQVGGSVSIGAGMTTGTISIGGTGANTGDFDLAPGTGAQVVTLAANDGVKAISIGDGIDGNTITIGNGINTSAQVIHIANNDSAADSTVHILGGDATAGVQTLNLAEGNYAKTVNIATGTLGSTVNVLSGINSVAQVFNLATGASAASSTVNIMTGTSTAGTSTLNLATGAYAHAINVGTGAAVINTIAVGGTGANVITIGNLQTAGSVSIGAAMTTGTISIGGTGAQTGTFDLAPGTGAQTIRIATAGSGAKTIAIGATGSQNIVTIGSTTATSTLALSTPTGVPVVADNGLTATVGDLTTTNGNVVLSTAATYVSLPGPVFIRSGSGAPAGGLALHVGDMYIRTDAGGATERIYVATAVGAWTNVTCAA